MKLHHYVVCVGLAGALSWPVASYGATEQELLAVASPIVRVRSGPSNQLRPYGQSGWVVVMVSGKRVDFQGGMVVESRGSLMVPLRPIGEALGAQVAYNAATKTVTASRAGFRLTLRDGITILKGNTLVPLRTLSESLGVQVSVTNPYGIMRIALSPTHNGRAGLTVISGRNQPSAPMKSSTENDITEAHLLFNLKQLNALRARAGAPALQLDARLNEFARQGSLELMRTHVPHGHFSKVNVWQNGFERAAAENQGDPHGWFPGPVNQSIDQILQAMMDEGLGGGHHDNILNPAFRRVGIGLVMDANGRLYFTNDFSG